MPPGTPYTPRTGRFQRSVVIASVTLATAAVMTVVPANSANATTTVTFARSTTTKHAPLVFAEVRHARAAFRASVQRTHRETRALRVAAAHLGAPYVYGANGPSAFDCSGLVQYALTRAGFAGVARTAAEQAQQARHISRDDLQPGDLIFFDSGWGVYHVAFFARWDRGEAVILHAPYAGASVSYTTVWTDAWFAGTYR